MKFFRFKKIILIISGLITTILLFINTIGTFKVCGSVNYGTCMDIVAGAMFVLFPFMPLFVFTAITYKMRDSVYAAWFNFAKWWVPLSMLAILISPEYSNDWMLPIEKGSVAFVTSVLFVAISIGILVFTSFRSSAKK